MVAAVAVPLSANATVDLPDLTPEELLTLAHSSDVDALSGTIEQTSELGLPDLGGILGEEDRSGDGSGGAGPADALDLLVGSHTAHVYLDGDRARLQVLDRLAERNVYIDGAAGAGWFVDSETGTATRFAVTGDREALRDALEEAKAQRDAATGADAALPTPEQVLEQALDRLDDSTRVSVGTDGRVAGRDAYELILEPRTDDTLVGRLVFAIDGETGMALSASVTGRGDDQPAFRVGFTDISFQAPDASTLAFAPAEGYSVVEKDLPLPTGDQLDQWAQDHAATAPMSEEDRPVVHGEGWSAVVELPADGSRATGPATGDASADDLLQRMTRQVDGGRVLETALVSVLFADDGRVLAGAVPAQRLVDVAAGDG
ncbi:hypothetical protein EV279_2672 [Microbacterium sp. BK668]|nr:hypothetical protein EV279_2672 [Microbacterium sp. BK668]